MGCFCPWTLFRSTGFNLSQWNSVISNFYSYLGYSTDVNKPQARQFSGHEFTGLFTNIPIVKSILVIVRIWCWSVYPNLVLDPKSQHVGRGHWQMVATSLMRSRSQKVCDWCCIWIRPLISIVLSSMLPTKSAKNVLDRVWTKCNFECITAAHAGS